MHHRLGDWDLAEAHLAVVTELVADAEPGRLARAEADRAVVAYRRGDGEQAAAFGRAGAGKHGPFGPKEPGRPEPAVTRDEFAARGSS